MRIAVVVNGALVSLRPAQQHQVELSVALVDQVSSVAVFVKLGELGPVSGARLVRAEQGFDLLNVHLEEEGERECV